MAIYTGGLRQRQEAQAEASRLAKKQKKAAKKEGKRKRWSGVLGKIGGALAGAAAVGITGLTGGLAAPLMAGAVSSLSKKWIDEGTKKGRFGKGLSGASGSQIQATGKYGYGQKQAAQARQAIKESRKTDWSANTMLGDIASSYVTAGLSGGLSGAGTKLMSGKEGSFMEAMTGSAAGDRKFLGEGIKQQFGTMLGGTEEAATSQADLPLTQEELGQSQLFGGDYESVDPSMTINPEFDEEGWSITGEQGGQVPQQQQLMQLLALAQMQQQQEQTAYSGTPLEEEQQQSSIAEMFASQGKTLGGNNTQSLSQMLGR